MKYKSAMELEDLQTNPIAEQPSDGEERQRQKKKTTVRYVMAAVIAAVAVFVCCWIFGLFKIPSDADAAKRTARVFTVLWDSFAIVGFCYALVAGLLFCASEGTFDTLGYGMRQVFGRLFFVKSDKKYKDIHEYRADKAKHRPKFLYLLWIGLGLLAIALVLFFLSKTVG